MLEKIRSWLYKDTRPEVIVVVGPTASGKTSFAINLAHKLAQKGIEAEIISADTRQIYREIPVFSAAVTQQDMQGIPHHLVGTQSVRDKVEISAAWFRDQVDTLVQDITQRGRIPIIAGGSAFWVQGILFVDDYPKVEPNHDLRKELETVPLDQLQERLQQLDPQRFAQIDIENPRRLIRAIEIATALGYVPEMKYTVRKEWNTRLVYLDYPKQYVDERITRGVAMRFEQGLAEEAERLATLVSHTTMLELGLAYKYYEQYQEGTLSKEEWITHTIREEIRYAKRQRTFFKKMLTYYTSITMRLSDPQERDQAIHKLICAINRKFVK